jgi:predicted amidophosphoribosyltransferase
MAHTLKGNWKNGLAYDLHTISSIFLGQDEFGHNRFDTIRSKMGELVYQLKYKNDKSIVEEIITLLLTDIKGFENMDSIIATPPSNLNRENQPVFLIATALGKKLNIPVYLDCLIKDSNEELKNITDPIERYLILKKFMKTSQKYDLSNQRILLIDDLYRSGATLRVATELLYNNCNVKDVYVLTMTKTRSNR